MGGVKGKTSKTSEILKKSELSNGGGGGGVRPFLDFSQFLFSYFTFDAAPKLYRYEYAICKVILYQL